MVLGKLDSHMEKTGQPHGKHSLTPYTKINSKWIKGLNVRPDTIKLLEENIARMAFDINHNNIFFGQSPRKITMKTQINQCELF